MTRRDAQRRLDNFGRGAGYPPLKWIADDGRTWTFARITKGNKTAQHDWQIWVSLMTDGELAQFWAFLTRERLATCN